MLYLCMRHVCKNMKDIAFLVSTPYQILTAVIMKLNILKDDNVDIFVYDYFKDYEKLAQRVKDFGPFRAVTVCRVKKIYKKMIYNRFFRIKNLIFCNSFVKRYFGGSKSYNAIYYSIPDRNSIAAAKAFTKGNSNTEYYQIEDGFGSYYRLKFQNRTIVDKISGCSDNLIGRKVIYLYWPDLCVEEGKIKKIEKRKILFSPKDIHLISMVDNIFDYGNVGQKLRQVIYFDTLGDKKTVLGDTRHAKTVELLKDLFGEENFQVKIHPRRDNELYQNMNISVYPKQEIPFEVAALNENMEDKVLISYKSSAIFAPKMFIGQEPYIILLYKIENIEIEESFISFVERLKKAYNAPYKIMIPESYEELEECVNRIRNGEDR